MGLHINKFNFGQLFNDSNGKTDPSRFAGVIIVVVACGGFMSAGIAMIIMLVFKLESKPEIISFFEMLVLQSIAFGTIGAGLLGLHRFTKDEAIKITDGSSTQ